MEDIRVVEEIVEVDGKKMKKIKKYVKKHVQEFVPKGIAERQNLAPFGIPKVGEPARFDKNPCFFEVHGRGKQIKVKVDTQLRINQQLREIDKQIEGDQVKIKELEEDKEMDFAQNFYRDRDINDQAVVRISNIPDAMTIADIRAIFSKYGRIIMLTMPKPTPTTEDQIRNQKRAEKRMKKQAKRFAKGRKEVVKEVKEEEEKETKKEEVKEEKKETERTHRGFAYVYYEESQSSNQAIINENDCPHYSQIISVKKARPRPRNN